MSIRRLHEVLETIGETLIAAVDLPALPPVVRIGAADEIARNDVANRVVMEPFTATLEGGRLSGTNTLDGAKVRALFTRAEAVRFHIWGASIDEVEELEELLMNAVVATVAWSFRPGTATWIMRNESQRGFVKVQELTFLIPIIRREIKAPLDFEPLATEFVT